MITKEQIEEMERLDKAATRTPWIQFHLDERVICTEDRQFQVPSSLLGLNAHDEAIVMEAEDAKLIVDVRNLLPQLLTLARAALDEIEWHEGELEQAARIFGGDTASLSQETQAWLELHRARLAKLKGE